MKNLQNALTLKQLYQLKQIGYRYTNLSPYQPKVISKNIEDINEIDILKDEALKCSLCDLSKSRQRVIFGDGYKNADIMFISNTPNSLQESSNELFIGRGGEMLANIIERVLLIPKSQIYLTHIVKCRPPNNTPITPTEAHSCLSYIRKEIELVKPKIIITLGEEAYNYLMGKESKMEEIRGVPKKMDNYIVVPTLHINSLLRDKSAKRYVFEDMKLVRRLYKKSH